MSGWRWRAGIPKAHGGPWRGSACDDARALLAPLAFDLTVFTVCAWTDADARARAAPPAAGRGVRSPDEFYTVNS